MVKLTGASVQTFLKKPNPAYQSVLIYGPDEGLVRERVERLAKTVVDDPGDPFRVATLGGPEIAKDPARLPDEAAALSMIGGRRVVRVRDVTDAHASALKGFVESPVGEALVLVQAGPLNARSSLRKLFENAPKAAALPCYADEGRSLETVIREQLAEAQVAADAETLAFLVDHLGADRALTRSEIDKLITYVGPGNRATVQDARDCVGDTARLGMDDLIGAAASGDADRAIRTLNRLLSEGVNGVAIVRMMMKHFSRLHLACAFKAEGRSVDQAIASFRPPLFQSAAAALKAQASRWSTERAAQALDLLLDAEKDLKTTGARETPIMERLVLRLTRGAGGR